jgi:ATP/maltotriose-dependent transcriptional regulator MalT
MTTFADALAAFRSGATGRTEELALQLLTQARDDSELAGQVDALCMLARVALRRGDLAHAVELASEARALARSAGEPRMERMPIHMQAAATRMRGAYSEARILYRESIELNVQLGEKRMVAVEHRNLAYVELHDGRPDRARDLFSTASEEARALNLSELEPFLLLDAAVIAFESGDTIRAAQLATSMREALAASGQIPDPDDAAEKELLETRLFWMGIS